MQLEQVDTPEVAANVPEAHEVHTVAPEAAAMAPGVQLEHAVTPVFPLYLPVMHDTHAVAPTTAFAKVPVRQEVQLDAPATETVPATQATQSVVEAAPVLGP